MLTVIAPFGAIGLATLVRRRGASVEVSRKLIHILLSNWILLALAVYRSAWACVVPACFVLLNYLSYRKGIFSAMERAQADNTLGTVWYALSLFLLCLAGYTLRMPWIAACGMLAMGYGDGLGALVGSRWGKLHFPSPHHKKTFEGMMTVLLFSGLAVGFACAVCIPDPAPGFALRAALACAAPAAAIELFTPYGVDNLTLPLGVGLIVFLLARFPLLWPVLLCFDITLLILICAYYLRAITFTGLGAAAALGVCLFLCGGWLSFNALILFFLLGSAVSRAGKARKASASALHEHQGARSVAQVLANGLPSLLFALLYRAAGLESCLPAALACFAGAAADTFSSEIGMLSKREPVCILTWKPVQRGMSGGVTPLGVAAGAAGALAVSLLTLPRFGAAGALAIAGTGLASSLLDSVLGAAFQAKYQMCAPTALPQRLTERKSLNGAPLKLVKGLAWVNNDVVNFASILICGSLLALFWR